MGLETILAGLALAGTAAGAGTSMAANAEDQSAENNVVSQELARQQGYQNKDSQVFNQNVSKNAGATNAQTQMAQGSGDALGLYQALQQGNTGGGGSGLTALDPSNQALVAGRTGQQNQANAALQGYNAWGTQQGLANQLAGSQIGLIGGESSADSSNTPSLLSNASHTGDGLAGLGSLLSTVGMGAGLAGIGLGGLGGLGATAGAADQGVNGWGIMNEMFPGTTPGATPLTYFGNSPGGLSNSGFGTSMPSIFGN